MKSKTGISVTLILIGTAIEAVGMFLDILHHLNIGIKTQEGLLTPNHLAIFIGFLINFIGVMITLKSRKS